MFDRKVTEADTYLQMMIDQTTKIEQRIEAIESEEEREKYRPLQQQANEMLDHIKHSIVLLQIAKVNFFPLQLTFFFHVFLPTIQNTAVPINGIYNGPMKTEPDATASPGNVKHMPPIAGE